LTDDAENNTAETKSNNRYENKNCAVHKEVLRKDAYHLILIPVKKPIVLSREEHTVENCKSLIKVYRNDAAYQGKAAEGVCAG